MQSAFTALNCLDLEKIKLDGEFTKRWRCHLQSLHKFNSASLQELACPT